MEHLVGCTVSPGFESSDFELGRRSELLAQFPQARELIERLTVEPMLISSRPRRTTVRPVIASSSSPLALVAVLACLGCGRTRPVHYSGDGGDDWAHRKEDGGVACVEGELALLRARPVVMLVLDRSSSMSQTFPGTTGSKWTALRGALHQALPPWGSSLELGALLFPSTTSGGCTVGASADLAPALENVSVVLAKLDATSPGGSTPTAIALQTAGAALSSRRTAGSARALVLATDGAPDCNTALNPRTCTCVGGNGTCTAVRCLDDTRSLERLGTLAASGIPTWVVGLRSNADAIFVDVLNRMAVAGGRPQAGAQRFYSASSQQELESALGTIRQQVGGCRYLTPSVPDVGGTMELELDGAFVPYDPTQTEGWTWIDADNGELVLSGPACAHAQELPLGALVAVVRCAP